MKQMIYILLLILGITLPVSAEDRLFLLQDNCVRCHLLYEIRAEENSVLSWKDSVHFLPDASCSDCHGGDRYLRMEFRKGHMGKPSFSESIAMCENCHKTEVTLFKDSYRGNAGKKACEASCISCHDPHRTLSLKGSEIFGKTCSSCHSSENSLGILQKIKEVETVSADIESSAGKKERMGLPVDTHMAKFHDIYKTYVNAIHKMNMGQLERHISENVLPGLYELQSDTGPFSIIKWQIKGIFIIMFFTILFVLLVIYQMIINEQDRKDTEP